MITAMTMFRKLLAPLSLALGVLAQTGLPTPAAAQGLFSPVITVDGAAITGYELKQRIAILQVLGNAGNLEQSAREGLIDDRLRLAAARQAGLDVTDDGLQRGMEEFAGRANLTREEFVSVLRGRGVDEETFRDFVRAGLLWRELVRQRFGSRAAISDAEIDRALGAGNGSSGLRVLLSEIILPARPNRPQEVAQSTARAERISQLTSTAAFAAQARSHSVVASRGRGGRLDWVNVSNLPGALRSVVLGLSPGQVSQPISIPNAIALFQLRGIEEVAQAAPAPAAIEYAAFYIPGGRSERALGEAARIKSRLDTCDDLYGVAKGLPEERLERGTLPVDQIPDDILIELAKLDENEVSYDLTRANGETLVLLMMCGRTNTIEEQPDREAVRARLRSQRLAGFAESYLAELRAAADIVEN